MWVRSLGGEDPLEKDMATHSSILAWRTQWAEEPGGLQSLRSQSQTRLIRLGTQTTPAFSSYMYIRGTRERLRMSQGEQPSPATPSPGSFVAPCQDPTRPPCQGESTHSQHKKQLSD